MRKVSYTQMRAELSDILDAIRNGETVVVTQRGRPDTILNGSLTESGREQSENATFGRNYTNKAIKTYVVEGRSADGKNLYARSEDGVLKIWPEANAKSSSEIGIYTTDGLRLVKSSFKDALNRTRVKHAKIIKALEDK